MQHLAPLLVLAGLALAVLVFYFVVSLVSGSLQRVGLTRGQAGLIIAVAFLGQFVNLPLGGLAGWDLYINLGGGIVPIAISVWLVARQRLPANELLVGLLLVTAVSFLVTDFDPERGVVAVFPLWLLPAAAAMLIAAAAWWNERQDAAALAYVTGSMGALIGADLLRLPQIAAATPVGEGALSIGGAAVFDMVFLTGILAVAMQGSITARRTQTHTTEGSRIDREFDEWLERKRREQEDYERQRVGGRRRPERTTQGVRKAPPPFLADRSSGSERTGRQP